MDKVVIEAVDGETDRVSVILWDDYLKRNTGQIIEVCSRKDLGKYEVVGESSSWLDEYDDELSEEDIAWLEAEMLDDEWLEE